MLPYPDATAGSPLSNGNYGSKGIHSQNAASHCKAEFGGMMGELLAELVSVTGR